MQVKHSPEWWARKLAQQHRVNGARHRVSQALTAEDRRFGDRLRFDQAKVWDWNRELETRSTIPSTHVGFSEWMELYGPCGTATGGKPWRLPPSCRLTPRERYLGERVDEWMAA